MLDCSPQIFVTGSVCMDLILGTHLPWAKPGTEIVLPHSETRPGGGAGNMALALHAMNAKFTLLGNRGADAIGDWLETTFSDMKVVWARSSLPTSVSVGITHPDSERTFFTHLGHLEDYRFEQLIPTLETAKAGDYLMLVGAFFSPLLRQKYLQLIALARAKKMQIALDTGWSPDNWTTKTCQEVQSWIQNVDHVLINQAEAMALTQSTQLEDAIVQLRQIMHPNAILIVKRGAKGALLQQQSVLVNFSAPKVKVIDTIGAGDTFNAAYLHTLAQGESVQTAVQAGVKSASFAISTNPRRYTLE